MKRSALFCLLLSIACSQPALTAKAQTAPGQSAPAIASTLELNGPDGRHLSLTADALQSMPRQTVQVHNSHTKAEETYQGVALSLLLARLDAPLGPKLRGKALTMYVVAEGTDKYRVVYSLAEVDPAFHAGTVIVADREDGQRIGKDGPFKLVNTEDKLPARWIRNLASIHLSSIP
jgi:hypothetical protein